MCSYNGVRNGAPTAVSGTAVLPLSPLPGAPGGAGTGLPLLRARGGWAGLGGAAWGLLFVCLAAAVSCGCLGLPDARTRDGDWP